MSLPALLAGKMDSNWHKLAEQVKEYGLAGRLAKLNLNVEILSLNATLSGEDG